MYSRKTMLLRVLGVGVILLFGMTSTSDAQSKDADPNKAVEALFPKVHDSDTEPEDKIEDLSEEFSAMEKTLKAAETRIDKIEERLGPTTRRPTLATSFDRRLADVEKRLTRIERQIAKLQNLEKRVRKLERQN